ncbi:MAG: preprotein translocase subunit YajC [Rikenellaceae bacterium]|jgi:preprotein translocase subunit YajC|nr:preprotein translocase subunit YajC [Rikenellaceae bacterium]
MNNLFIMLQPAAPAAGEAAGKGGLFGPGSNMIFMMVLIFAVMYFFMFRPQQKRQKEIAKFRDSLEKGQKVVTIGGVYGTIKDIKETKVLVEVDNNVTIWFDKAAISKDPSDIGGAK